jgi:probable rRNA maturation factor
VSVEVSVTNRQRGHRVSARGLAQFLGRVARAAPTDAGALGVRLVSDRGMRGYNRRFRGIDATTDVLSFPAGEGLDPRASYLGDIVISVATAARQARRARHALQRELALLALHGYLHLAGYDHETDDGRMRRLERRLGRELLGVGRPRVRR